MNWWIAFAVLWFISYIIIIIVISNSQHNNNLIQLSLEQPTEIHFYTKLFNSQLAINRAYRILRNSLRTAQTEGERERLLNSPLGEKLYGSFEQALESFGGGRYYLSRQCDFWFCTFYIQLFVIAAIAFLLFVPVTTNMGLLDEVQF